jgi:hypothetical protein
MTKGKQWSAQEEAELKSLVEANARIDEISIKLQKTPGAIFLKCKRLGIELKAKGYANTSIPIPRELPSVEETAKILAGALKLATQPGLDKIEVQRLQTVATITKIYKEHLADYINYRQIEAKLREMEELNGRLLRERSQSSSSQPDTSQMA